MAHGVAGEEGTCTQAPSEFPLLLLEARRSKVQRHPKLDNFSGESDNDEKQMEESKRSKKEEEKI
eukprot:13238117-Ditylum_brightwellii.AAC.1